MKPLLSVTKRPKISLLMTAKLTDNLEPAFSQEISHVVDVSLICRDQ